jgi:TRAP-type uncharacterized transport system substrate-binding protein
MADDNRGISRLIPTERLQRVLGLPQRAGGLSTGTKLVLFFAALALIALLVAIYYPVPDLAHVKVAILSGSKTGNYYPTVEKIGTEVEARRGKVTNVASAGSVENVRRLIAAKDNCALQFALVQDGVEYPDGHGLELVGRLPRPEALVVLGRDADRLKSIEQLRGLRLGIGPEGSGTAYVARRAIAPLAALDLKVSMPTIDQQLDMLERGELDLGAMVIDEDAQILVDAVRKRNLQILSFPDAPSLARRLPFARVGHLDAGQYDLVRKLPPEDKQVLNIDTLVVGNGCASLSATQGLMAAINEVFPTFIRHNRNQPNLTGLKLAPAAKSFFDEEGPDTVGKFVPWVVDIMPTATWLRLLVGFSMLFSGMALANRYRLWRIDAARVKVEREIPALFGPGTTVGDIANMEPTGRQRDPAFVEGLDRVITSLSELAEQCRKHSLSVVVPMGEEMSYRYQETLIADLLHALRLFRDRVRA